VSVDVRRRTGTTELDDALGLVLDRMRGKFIERLRAVDLTPPSAITLKLLVQNGPMPLRAVADHFNIDASAVTWIADRLETRGLAVREPDPDDRRVKLLTITAAGRSMARSLHGGCDEFPGIAALSAADRSELARLLRLAFA
jgi:DNA-binding MarR family transcriptional regulator